jgi:ferredoxin
MMLKINHEFSEKIKKYGAFDINACYNCGNCTAICPLSTEDNSFPRKMIRATILGLEDKIESSMDPWLCYYCGECSDTCPRDADPGGLMMALRRYQIRKFSLGKVADIFYNGFSSLFAWILLTLFAIGGIYVFGHYPDMEKINPLSMISLETLHDGGIIAFVFLILFAFFQIYIMMKSVKVFETKSFKFSESVKGFFNVLFKEVLVQKRFSECEDKSRYIAHLSLVLGFIGLFIATIIVMMIDLFISTQSGLKIIPKVIGVISGLPAIYGSIYFLYKRGKQQDKYSEYSHHTDWIFIILIFLAILSGYALDICRWGLFFKGYYISFALHLVIVFELIITLPFTKFSHLMYRPIAVWLAGLKNKI